MVGELQFLPDVLPPGGVEGDQFREEVGPHGSFNHVGVVEGLLVVIAFHPAASSFNILAQVHQDLIELGILIRDLLPIHEDATEVDDGSVGEEFGHGEDPSVCFPSDIGDRILDEPEEVLEASLLVALIDALLSEPEFLEFPVILFSHRAKSVIGVPISHFQSFEAVRCPIVHVVVAVISLLEKYYLTLTPSSTGAWRTHR